MMLYWPKQVKIANILTSEIELRDLAKAWIAISIAFAVVMTQPLSGQFLSKQLYANFIIASLTVGVGFLLHELAHKFVAQRYGCFAEFRASNFFLLLAIVMSFSGFVFAAPGAVMISGPVGVRRNGKISVAGPVVNLALASAFLAILFFSPDGGGLWSAIALYGFIINSWLVLFNMIPLGNFDGLKILRWNKPAYFAVLAASAAFVFMRGVVL